MPQTSGVLIRADASARMGTGHVMRCLALAQAWQDRGGMARFLCAELPGGIAARLAAERFPVSKLAKAPGSAEDAAAVVAEAQRTGAAWVVVDGYPFGTAYQERLQAAGLKVWVIDDRGHAGRFAAELILNQNIYAKPGLYPLVAPETRLLLGPRYALLRREFWPWRGWVRPRRSGAGEKILVTLGGADPDNVTARVVEAIADIPDASAEIVLGAGNPNAEALLARSWPEHLRFHRAVDTMAELMAGADVAVSAAGSTTLELAFMQLPGLLLVLAENQVPVADGMAWAGAGKNLGWARDATAQLIGAALRELLASGTLDELGRQGRALVDGRGPHRGIAAMQSLSIDLRRVRESDAPLLWEWANEESTRAVSFRSEPIPWKEHVKWLGRKLSDPNCYFYIVMDLQGTPLGQVRFEMASAENRATISLSLAPAARGRGTGSAVLIRACDEFQGAHPGLAVIALIKSENAVSRNAFSNAGFAWARELEISGLGAVEMIRPAQ